MAHLERSRGRWARGFRWVLPLWAVCCVMTSSVRADDPDTQFNDRVAQALALEEAGDAEAALDALNAALAAIRDETDSSYAKARVRVLYKQAALLRTLGRLEQSRAVLEVVQRSPGLEPGDREVVLEKLRALDAEIVAATAAQAPGTVMLTAVDADGVAMAATVSVAGVAVGTTPLQLVKTPGQYTLQVSAEGHHTWVSDIDVAAGANTEQEVRLMPIPRSRFRIAAWSSLAVSLAAGIAGGALHGVSLQTRADADVLAQYALAKQTAARAEVQMNAALGLYVTAAAVGVTTVVLFLLGDEEETTTTTLRVLPSPLPDGGLLTGALSFP
jgi:hypothetical protein